MEHFHELFPSLTEKEVRSVLGAYLFRGKDAMKRVSSLSGGEKSRLVLAELLYSRPNFLILDEPTNHMDVQAKETLESAFQVYTGTILFVSHDRYFIKQVADSVMIFEDQTVMYYPFGYEHYLERREKQKDFQSISAQVRAEEQALIAGLRAAPKAEHHRLKEIPTQEAYVDWKIRLATERMEQAREHIERLEEERESLYRQWIESKGKKYIWERQKEYEESIEEWHKSCMEWGAAVFGWDELGDKSR